MQRILDFLLPFAGKRIALLAHQRPDGDALGSAVGLADILSHNGYTAHVVNPLPFPAYLSFIDPGGRVQMRPESDWHARYDCVGVLDCGEAGRLDEVNRAAVNQLPAFTIDHHASSEGLGAARWICPTASSTGEMVVRLADAAGWRMPPGAAQALWVAIVTDTGRFCYENATAACLDAARRCVEQGAKPSDAAARLYQCVSVAERRLQALVLSRMELLEGGRLSVSWLRREDFKKARSGIQDTQNLISLIRDTEGVEAAVFLYEPMSAEARDEVKVSCRTSSPHNCLELVGRFGGGGHERAAGCTISGSIESARGVVVPAAVQAFFRESGIAARQQ